MKHMCIFCNVHTLQLRKCARII